MGALRGHIPGARHLSRGVLEQKISEVGLCLDPGHRPGQVWEAAACREVDLIVLCENLFGRFRRVVKGNGPDEVVEGAPCPRAARGSRRHAWLRTGNLGLLSKRDPIP